MIFSSIKNIKFNIYKVFSLILLLPTLSACVKPPPDIFYKKPKHQLRVVTYNVNWSDCHANVPNAKQTLDVLKKTNADIVLLQETTPFWEEAINGQFKHRYPYQRFIHHHSAGGFAVLSRYPIVDKKYVTPSYGWHPAWVFVSKTPLGNIQFLNLHLTPPLVAESNIGFLGSALFTSPGVRLREAKEYYKLLDPGLTTIIAGDLNEGDGSRSVEFFKGKGYIDALDQVPKRYHTWEWRIAVFKLKDRFDRIFYTRDLQSSRSQVLMEGASDHFPVVVDFKRP